MFYTYERAKRIVTELETLIYRESDTFSGESKVLVDEYRMLVSDMEFEALVSVAKTDWQTYTTGNLWGGRNLHVWFETCLTIPQQFDGQPVALVITTGFEGEWDALNPQFVGYVNGKLIQGLDVNHRELLLTQAARAGEVFTIYLRAYSGMQNRKSNLFTTLVAIDREIENLYYNLKVPTDIVGLLEKEDKNRIDILKYLETAINLLDLRRPYNALFFVSVREANHYMEEQFYGQFCGHHDVIATSVGHTHIDVAWLWTLAQTREKTVRSFSTVLELMKQYPEYKFMSSQPQLYQYLKQDAPELYEQVKERIAQGRWEAEGGMWLEADCNVTSGESLVRQLLFGARFFEKEFGVKSKILWLPDVFGYSAALPQILKKAGIDYFMTTKISWSQYNKLPYDTFMWKGMDGTEILTHFITATDMAALKKGRHMTTYNANLIADQVMGSWARYQQKNINHETLISFGYGDGGGGPTREMLENGRRMAKGIPGCPRVEIDTSAHFFKRLEDRVSGNRKLPKWVGELYLEYHRGTYTSVARNKRYNRKSEFLYQDAETFSSLAMLQDGTYPQESLNRGWETILLNQFHDILPGSSIKEVYEDSQVQYQQVLSDGKAVLDAALERITTRIGLHEPSIVVFNSLSFTRDDVVEVTLPIGFTTAGVLDTLGNPIPSQIIESDGCRKLLFVAQGVPSKGYKTYHVSKAEQVTDNHMVVDVNRMENQFFDLRFSKDGSIASLFDKVNHRPVLKEGVCGNVLQAFEDKPIGNDAWDIDIYYQEKMWEIRDVDRVEIRETGPVRAVVRFYKRFLESVLVQDVMIYHDIARIDFANHIDWKEKQILLKAAFPINLNATVATYEIQYGNVQRPTHWNTSWDLARFEVVGHKWADVSEEGYGISLLNDCKYGYDIKEDVMRLTLLKSATSPNVDADREHHEFIYSLYPHAGDWKAGGTVPMAYQLNVPLYGCYILPHEGNLPETLSLVELDCKNAVIEVVKKAEDSKELIVRLYECHNRRGEVKLTFYQEVTAAWECDLLENNMEQIITEEKSFHFQLKPYEIKTFKVRMADGV